MPLFRFCCVLMGLAGLFFCQSAGAYQPIRAEKDSLLFQDTFSRTEIGDGWQSHADSFFIEDSAMLASQLPDAGHGAVTRARVEFKDVWIAFDFKFEGAERFNFVVDDKNEKSVHAGHICRLSVNRNRLIIQDDKTGVMNLEIRKARFSADPDPELEELLKSKRAEVAVDFEEGRWYRMKVLIQGDRMEVHLDGEFLVGHQSPGFAHPTKTQFGFTVTGQSLFYDHVEAWSLK